MAKNRQKNNRNLSTEITKLRQETSQVADYQNNSFQINPTVAKIILGICTLLAFVGGWKNDFVIWDDPAYVLENIYVLKPTFKSLLTLLKVEAALNYHPITMASLWLNSFLFGTKSTSFIVTNTILHIINTLLVYKFTTQLTKHNILVSFLVALIWGVHPMHVESVTWIAERKDLLYTLFFFLSCIQYVKFIESANKKYLVLCFVFFVLSCLSKGMAVVLPIVLLLIDYWLGRGFITFKNIVPKIPFFIVSLLFGMLAVHVQGGGDLGGILQKMTLDVAISDVLSLSQRIKFGFYSFLVYIFKFFFPINQHNFYEYPPINEFGAFQYTIAPVFALVILGGAVAFYKYKKEIFFGMMFFFVTIVLVLQFLSVGGAILAERYTYIPYFGLAFALFYFLDKYIQSKKLLLTATSVVAVIFMYLTYKQTLLYKDTGILFENSYKYEQNSGVVNEKLANYYGSIGEIDNVIRYGEFAVSKGINAYPLLSALANAYYLKGNPEKALELYQKSLDGSPAHRKSIVYHNRGLTYRDSKRYAEAAKDFEMAMKASGDSVTDLPLRAFSRLHANQHKLAIEDYTKMITLGMSVDTAYNNRAVAKFNMGDTNGAIEDLKQALKSNPNYVDVRNNLQKLGVKQ